MTSGSFFILPAVLVAAMLLLAPVRQASGDTETGCKPMTGPVRHMEERTIKLVTGDSILPVTARIADEGVEMRAGFQHICADAYDDLLILFVYGQEVRGRFHMRNVHDELDIGFFDGNGQLLEVKQMQPYPPDARAGPLTGPASPFRFALEAKAGYFAEHGLRPGETRLVWPD